MGAQKKLLFITTRLFWPTNSGRKVSLYYYCKGLHEQYDYDVYLYSFLEEGQSESEIEIKPDFIKAVRIAKPISLAEKMKNILSMSLTTKQWPLQCSLYFSKENCQSIRKYCNEIEPDVVMTDMIRTAPYLAAFKDLNCKKILDMDDLLSIRYKRQLNSVFSKANVAGQYGKSMSGMMNKIVNGKKAKHLVLTMESKRLRKAELQYAKLYDSVIFVSDNETEHLNEQLGMKKAFTVTMGSDYAYFSQPMPIEKQKDELSFVGNMNVAANVDTLRMIAEYVLPKIKHKVILKVIGMCPDSLRSEYANRMDIEFCGQVDDLRKYVCETEVFLAPIAYGSGIKTKILEAMAMGMPVVTNSVGAEGIAAKSNKHFLVSDEYDQMAADTDCLLDNAILRSQIADAAQKLVQIRYNWDVVWKSFGILGV